MCKSFSTEEAILFSLLPQVRRFLPPPRNRNYYLARDPRNGKAIGKAWLDDYDPGSNYPRELISRCHKPKCHCRDPVHPWMAVTRHLGGGFIILLTACPRARGATITFFMSRLNLKDFACNFLNEFGVFVAEDS